MKKILYITLVLITSILLQGCGSYSFTGTNYNPDIKTFQVNNFQNQAAIVEPGIDRTFTNDLQDLIQNQTNLSLVTSGGHLIYEGEIVQYYISPNTATSSNTAAQNRLTVAVNVRFYDTLDSNNDFEQRFSFFYDYPANSQLVGALRDEALEVIYERLTQDIFNASLAKW